MKEHDENKPDMSTLTVRVESGFKRKIKVKAAEKGLSMSEFIRRAIAFYLAILDADKYTTTSDTSGVTQIKWFTRGD